MTDGRVGSTVDCSVPEKDVEAMANDGRRAGMNNCRTSSFIRPTFIRFSGAEGMRRGSLSLLDSVAADFNARF